MTTTSNFTFLKSEFPILYNVGISAEYYLHQDPAAALWKIRGFGEKISEILFKEHALQFPTENNFANRLRLLGFEGILPQAVKDLFFYVRTRGNKATHDMEGTFTEAREGLLAAFKISKWFYETYSTENDDIFRLSFVEPQNLDARHALHLLETDYGDLEEKYKKLLSERDTNGLSIEKQQSIQQRSEKAARKIEWSEAETRKLIDQQLRRAGWEVDTDLLNYKKNKTLPQRGKAMAISEWPAGSLWADYALFIGTEFYGIVEAKKYAQDISTDLGQSKAYAKEVQALSETVFLGTWDGNKVPFLFSTNGREYLEQIKTKSGVWFLDVRNKNNHAKALHGWYSPAGLEKLRIQDIEESNKKLLETPLDFLTQKNGLGLREYQLKAIQAVEQKIVSNPSERKALLAMATGTGKTRTIIGLCYHLIQTNRFNRILFLVDRTLLGTQALDAFKDNKVYSLNTFTEVYKISSLKDAIPDTDTRLHFATVQSMVKRLYYNDSESDLPPVDQYDCIIIDEAHRGYLLDREIDEDDLHFKSQMDYVSKYRMVLDYFDAYVIGLTATPALHTTEIFGKPVYTYSYREAVIDGFLIDHDPPTLIKTKLSEEGIEWKAGERPKSFDKENNTVIELDELEDELQIDVSGFNKKVITESFNRTVIQQLVKELDPDGDEKTLVFAATNSHADMVVSLFKEEFLKLGVHFPDDAIMKITGSLYDPQTEVTKFKNEKYPTIVVTVDLLTTGIDVPAICNIVFLRRVKSRILFEQMLGRATRRCDEIGKKVFRIYDAVKIYDTLEKYSQMKPVVVNPTETFVKLVSELEHIDNETRAWRQIEQIIAKLQRKKRQMSEYNLNEFTYRLGGVNIDEFAQNLRKNPLPESLEKIQQLSSLWNFLDEKISSDLPLYFSEHQDEYLRTETGYGNTERPEDYLESFTQFIKENQNKISALQIVCTRPEQLDRRSLKELLIALGDQGFEPRVVKAAWKQAKNEDLGADIISFIRTLAIGSVLESHEDRIKRAVDRVRRMQNWNRIQQKWIDRFEKQLIKESVLQVEDLNQSPFIEDGGFQQLNKIFDKQLEHVINTINQNMYQVTA